MEALFWVAVAFVAYVYAGYPVLIAGWARAARRTAGARPNPKTRRHQPAPPGVSIIVAARNEAGRLPARIDNLLASDYPAGRIQILVASDGSTDDTEEALAPYRDTVQLLKLPARGKASALNMAVMHARHPILVFADARQRFAPETIRRLADSFQNPHIGAVSGELVLDCEESGSERHSAAPASTIGDGVGVYWKYEKALRRYEATVGSMVGVTGAVYAMRRWLWQPLPPGTLLDDVLTPMRIVLRGYRVALEPRAVAYDVTAPDASSELRRKIRTLAGNFQLLALEPRLLVPVVNPVWLQFMSHKVGRLLVPYALVAVGVSSALLARSSWLYASALACQLAFYGLAVYGAILDRRAAPPVTRGREVFSEAA